MVEHVFLRGAKVTPTGTPPPLEKKHGRVSMRWEDTLVVYKFLAVWNLSVAVYKFLGVCNF
jgi:hypothetical protein